MPPVILNIRWNAGVTGDERPARLALDVRIILDGRTLIEDILEFGAGKPSRADFSPFDVPSGGKHRLRVETTGGKATLEMDILLGKANYLQINYLFRGTGKKGELTAFIQDRPHYFR